MTIALQHNDLAAVQKFENAETATEVNRARVGRASDALVAARARSKDVKETSGDPPRCTSST